jgi:formate/nitrite transporter FocA (FNT family)
VVPFTTAMNWIGSSCVTILFPIISQNMLENNPWTLYLFFAAWNWASLAFNRIYMLETKDKTEK